MSSMIEGMQPIGAKKVCKLESNPRRLTAKELSEGMWVKGHIWEYEFEVGRIHFSNEEPTGSIYVCQDSFTGENIHLAYGFKYSWWLPKSCLNIEGTKENTCQLYRIPAPEPPEPKPEPLMICKYTGTCIINCHAKDRKPHKERDGCHIGSGYCEGCIPYEPETTSEAEYHCTAPNSILPCNTPARCWDLNSDSGKNKHCGYWKKVALKPYGLHIREAKMEEYNINRNCVRMGDGRLCEIPMSRRQAQELGIIRGKSEIRRVGKRNARAK